MTTIYQNAEDYLYAPSKVKHFTFKKTSQKMLRNDGLAVSKTAVRQWIVKARLLSLSVTMSKDKLNVPHYMNV